MPDQSEIEFVIEFEIEIYSSAVGYTWFPENGFQLWKIPVRDIFSRFEPFSISVSV